MASEWLWSLTVTQDLVRVSRPVVQAVARHRQRVVHLLQLPHHLIQVLVQVVRLADQTAPLRHEAHRLLEVPRRNPTLVPVRVNPLVLPGLEVLDQATRHLAALRLTPVAQLVVLLTVPRLIPDPVPAATRVAQKVHQTIL